MPKRKPFSSFVHIPQDLDFKIREGIPTGFYLIEGGGGAWIYYGGMEGNQPSGMKIPSTSLMREIAEHLINLADQIDRSRHWP